LLNLFLFFEWKNEIRWLVVGCDVFFFVKANINKWGNWNWGGQLKKRDLRTGNLLFFFCLFAFF